MNKIQNQNEARKAIFFVKFAENFRKLRKQKGLTQQALAARIGADVSKISRVERGMYNFRVASLPILAEALEVSVAELLDF